MNEPHLPQRPEYASNTARVANRPLVDAHVGSIFARMTREHAAAKLREAGTAYGFVNAVAELAQHPALRRISVETPNGLASIIAPPTIRDGKTPELGRVPNIGEHSAAIRAEFIREVEPAQ